MRVAPSVFTAALCGLLPHLAAAQTAPPPAATGACTIVGPLLGPAEFGVPAGLPLADASAARLADGTLALYYGRFDPQAGGTINLARCPDPGAASLPTPTPAPNPVPAPPPDPDPYPDDPY